MGSYAVRKTENTFSITRGGNYILRRTFARLALLLVAETPQSKLDSEGIQAELALSLVVLQTKNLVASFRNFSSRQSGDPYVGGARIVSCHDIYAASKRGCHGYPKRD